MNSLQVFVDRMVAAAPHLAGFEDELTTWLRAKLAADVDIKIDATDPAMVALFWAAARADKRALDQFNSWIVPIVRGVLARSRAPQGIDDDIIQHVRLKLLLPDASGVAALDRYALSANVVGLIRVIARRELIAHFRRNHLATETNDFDNVPDTLDPVLQSLKERYANEFLESLRAAFLELSGEDRHLLRLNLSVRASIDDIARMQQVHRATAARKLESARARLAALTRLRLSQRLALSEQELTSMLRLVRTMATKMMSTLPPDVAQAG